MSRLVITDLTRFNNRDIVCVAGIDEETGRCIRPMLPSRPGYLAYQWVKENKLQPGSILDGSFTPRHAPEPHVEDRTAKIDRVLPQVSSDAFLAVLEKSAVENVQTGFGRRPDNRVFDREIPPPCSIITLKLSSPQDQLRIVEDKHDQTKIKAFVTDSDGYEMQWLPITDLGFYDHVVRLRKEDPGLKKLNRFLASQETLYLRVGLSREYRAKEGRDGYWVQLNGIYSFPEYRTDLRSYDEDR